MLSGFTRQVITATIANLGVMGLGSLSAWTSPALPSLENDSNFQGISSNEKAWIASIAHIGSIVACPIAGLGMKYSGRKISIVVFALLLVLSWIILGISNKIWMIYTGRFLTGLFAGAFKIIIPIFIGEISEKEHRGFLSGFYEIFLNLGILLTYSFGLVMDWRQLSYISIIFPAFLLFSILPIPDSPIYFIEKNDGPKAIKSIAWYKGKSPLDNEILQEIKSMEMAKKLEKESNQNLSYSEIFLKRENIIPLSITIWLNILEQFTGYSAFIFYTVNIFIISGQSANNAGIYTIIVGSVQIFGTILSSLLSDRAGRKPLLISSLFFMSLPLTLLGFYFFFQDQNYFPNWIPLLCMISFIFFMSIGIAPVSSTIPGEILPIKIREIGASLSIGISRATGFIVTFGFEAIQSDVGICFWIFAVFCFIGVVTVYLFIPETKGKSLNEIQELFKSKKSISTTRF